MLRRIPPFALLLFLFAACTDAPPADPDVDTMETPSAVNAADARPDAANPGPADTVPAGWAFRLDRPDPDVTIGAVPDSSHIYFTAMKPGWHVTTHPAAIFYHPASTAESTYRATMQVHLFDPGSRNEAHGLFVGGRDLQGPDQAYLYFLVRRSGEFLVKQRMGEETETLIDWTAHEAVVPYTDDTEGTAENTLAVEVHADQLHFFVNGTEVATLPKGDLPADGIVGWRINHGLNVHVEDFTVAPLS